MTRAVVYDAGALIAAERRDRDFIILHRRYLDRFVRPVVPVPVLAQVWAGGPRQAALVKALRACRMAPMTEEFAKRVGALRARTGIADVCDLSVVEVAYPLGATIVTSDPDDVAAILNALNVELPIERV